MGFAIAVILHPPNGAPFLEADTCRSTRSWHSILPLLRSRFGHTVLETCMNTGEFETQRIGNAMRGPKPAVPSRAGNNGGIFAGSSRSEIFPAKFKLSSRGWPMLDGWTLRAENFSKLDFFGPTGPGSQFSLRLISPTISLAVCREEKLAKSCGTLSPEI